MVVLKCLQGTYLKLVIYVIWIVFLIFVFVSFQVIFSFSLKMFNYQIIFLNIKLQKEKNAWEINNRAKAGETSQKFAI